MNGFEGNRLERTAKLGAEVVLFGRLCADVLDRPTIDALRELYSAALWSSDARTLQNLEIVAAELIARRKESHA